MRDKGPGSTGYRYSGPHDLLATVTADTAGRVIDSPEDLADLITGARDPHEPFTFVVDLAGRLLLADRHSEHVACAAGGRVRSAGEISFRRTAEVWAVAEVTNQSTGYSPEPSPWGAVAAAWREL